jgi:hypothetical protein
VVEVSPRQHADYQRPDPARWLWYVYGGRLPSRYREWVLHDVTCRTWVLRHLLRSVLQVLPFVVVLMLVIPAPLGLRAAAVLGGVLLGLLYSLAYMHEIVEHRVAKAGYPVGMAEAVRKESNREKHERYAERYAQTWRRPDG